MHMRLSTLLLTLHLAHSWVSVPKFISRAPYPRMAIVGWTRGEDSGDNVDVAAVEQLIQDRNDARRERDFFTADSIRDQLREMGVSLWDRDQVWTTGGKPPPRRDRPEQPNNFYRSTQRRAARYEPPGRYDEDYGFDGRVGRYAEPGDRRRGNRPGQDTKQLTRWNEWGHDYDRADDDASTTLDGGALLKVNEILRTRLRAKFDRQYERADELLDELNNEFGVDVNDGFKQWRADGQPFIRRHKRVGRTDLRVDTATVEELIMRRQDARRDRDYRTADDILAELLETHGVVLDDSQWSWRVTGGRHDGQYGEGGRYGRQRGRERARKGEHDYTREMGDAEKLTADQRKHIDKLLAERMQLKMSRNFEEADKLQAELRREGVEVDDRERTWRVAYPVIYEDDDDVEPPDWEALSEAQAEEEEEAEEADAAAEATEETTAAAEAELNGLTVPALKELCRERGLLVGGKKAELIARLLGE